MFFAKSFSFETALIIGPILKRKLQDCLQEKNSKQEKTQKKKDFLICNKFFSTVVVKKSYPMYPIFDFDIRIIMIVVQS